MGWGGLPEVSVEISRRRWRCVVDPHLCLSPEGAAFVHGLAALAEVWLGPEFLNILDSWMLYHREPELLKLQDAGEHDIESLRQALQVWLRIRNEFGLASARLCWVRDAVRESRLPEGLDESVVPRWEAAAEALDERLSDSADPSGPMVAAARDTAALTGILPCAILLSRHDRDEAAPFICRYLEAWRLPCRKLAAGDALVQLERNWMLQTVVEAGLAGFLWSGMRLSIVHIEVPGRARLPLLQSELAASYDDVDFATSMAPPTVRGVWEDAQAFWYELAVEN